MRRRMFYVMFGGKTEGWKFETAVHQAFQRTDLDGSGMLDKEELRMAFENMDMYLSHAQIDELVVDFDQDGDHRFDMDEFRCVGYIYNRYRLLCSMWSERYKTRALPVLRTYFYSWLRCDVRSYTSLCLSAFVSMHLHGRSSLNILA